MKLKILLQYRNRYFYLALALSLFILTINSLWYLILLVPLLYYFITHHNDLLKICAVILFIYIISLFVTNTQSLAINETYDVRVVGDIKTGEYTSFLARIKNIYIKVYFDEDLHIQPGDILRIRGETEVPRKNTIPRTFDYQNYLKSQGIQYSIFAQEVEYIESSFSMNKIPYWIESYIEEALPLSYGYIKTFILADKEDINPQVKSQINETGISHLFAVSGMHIAMLVLALEAFFKKVKMKVTIYQNIIIMILLGYLVITSFAPSVLRASSMYIFLVINKRYKLGFSSLDILSIIFIALLYFRPYYYFDIGFLLSFLVTFTILLSSLILKKDKKIIQLFLISLISFLVTIPIILNINYQINILTLVFNMVFLFYVSYIILPLSYISFILPFLDRLNYAFIYVFEYVLNLLSRIDVFIVKLFFPNEITVIIYYVLLFLFLISLEVNTKIRQRFLSILLLLIFIYITPYLNLSKRISFIDIYGDSSLIVDSFNRCNILIDTGETDDYNSVINYIKGKNIKRIDYLIISHFHSDHYGEVNDILDEFNVNTLISNNNIDVYENKLISCGSINMFIYPYTYENKNENNNSIVMSLYISDKHYLFTGDIEEKRESSFIKNFNIDIDYLKVAHHGSITSSTEEFLQDTKPEAAFIIASSNNRHGHPHDEVIKRYKDLSIPVYRTDMHGTIEVYYIFGKEYKRIHSP